MKYLLTSVPLSSALLCTTTAELFDWKVCTNYYGGPQLSRQNQKPHGKNKIPHGKTENLTAKTKYLTTKPKPSRQNQRPHGKTKYFTAKTKYLTAKANTHGKTNAILFCCEVFGLPWGFWFCREVFCFYLPWCARHCLEISKARWSIPSKKDFACQVEISFKQPAHAQTIATQTDSVLPAPSSEVV